MNLSILLFVSAVSAVSLLPALPEPGWLVLGSPIGVIGLVWRGSRHVAAVYLGFAWAVAQGAAGLADRLPASLEGREVLLTGTVVSVPQSRESSTRFRFRLDDCGACWTRATVDLSWYRADVRPVPGQRWQFTARLKRPRGSVNPHLFDYDGWLLSEGIAARGYVRTDPVPHLLGDDPWAVPHHRLRFWLREHLLAALDGAPLRGLIVALTLGESGEIGPAHWRTLSNTGTNHLLIISGLHIGLVAALGYRLFVLLLRRCAPEGRFCRNAPRIAGICALLLAAGYGAVAGFGLPVQRALAMAVVALSGLILGRRIGADTMFCVALLMVTLLDPLAALRPGFWLSFGAVFALLVAFAARNVFERGPMVWLAAAIRTQWVVFVGMFPLLLHLVSQVSLVSFAINLVAIPWIGLLVVPLLLLCIPAFAIHASLGAWASQLAACTLSMLWHLLEFVAALDWVWLATASNRLFTLMASLGAVILLLPGGVVPRWTGLVMALPLLTAMPGIRDGELVVQVLDVGQGLAVVVESDDGLMLYDAGPRYGERFDAGEQIVTPMLRQAGRRRRIDFLVVSHGDVDHAGGVSAVRRNFLAKRMFAQRGSKLVAEPCDDDVRLEQGDTTWTVFAARGGELDQNDRSCIVLVETPGFAVLLPGDIEAAGERMLVSRALPAVDVIVMPHHGSGSSSTPGLINKVTPDIAVVSRGYRNRFGHPDPAVLRRYFHRGVKILDTARDGAVTISWRPGAGVSVVTARGRRPRFWYDERARTPLPLN